MGTTAAIAHRPATPVRHDIPSLDGLRALAIVMVVLSHTRAILPDAVAQSGLFRYTVGGGLHGVQVFFVISGYIITTLLLREFDRTGEISLPRFYARRILRIFPAFYLYMLVLGVLWATGFQRQDPSSFLSAATYTIIYHPHPLGWTIEHTWSLSIEEQFYLLWPAILLLAHRRRIATAAAFACLAAMPILRILVGFSAQAPESHNRLIVSSSAIDTLMAGCLLALLAQTHGWRRWAERWITAWFVAALVVIGMLIVPYATAKAGTGPLAMPCVVLGFSVTAISIAAALEYLVRTPDSPLGRMLNAGPIRHLGILSYSVYLWQQLFTGFPRLGVLMYPLILIAAELSFWLIEKPIMRLRARLA